MATSLFSSVRQFVSRIGTAGRGMTRAAAARVRQAASAAARRPPWAAGVAIFAALAAYFLGTESGQQQLASVWSIAFMPRTDCHPKAIKDLQRLSPQGYAIYEAMTDKKQFLFWVTCDDVLSGLATAVHESVHVLTADRDAYPLIDGGSIHRPHEASRFFPPQEMTTPFGANDEYVKSYLRPGSATSADDFMYLLDELNAYSHDLHAAVQLVSLRPHDREVDHRDGLSALMSFVMRYADTAQRSHPDTWRGLMRPETRKVVQTLWGQAEKTLASSCGIPAFGMKDREYIGYTCDAKNGEALGELLGRRPICPRACLPPTSPASS